MSAILLETAARIGTRLCRAARRADGCTWYRDYDTQEQVSWELYHGTSGIALFLAELATATGDRAARQTATAAMHQVIKQLDTVPAERIGFYSGICGIAYAAYRVGECTGEEALTDHARSIVATVCNSSLTRLPADVVNGGAGMIPVLLWFARAIQSECPTTFATRIGDRLIANAECSPVGLSWRGSSPAVRGLTGYAHGASGIGLALLELAAATGDARFRFAGDQAFAYERFHYDAAEHNWREFRLRTTPEPSPEQARALLASPMDSVRAARGTKSTMRAWCHGAPGIGLARLRAVELFGAKGYLADLRLALDGTVDSLQSSARRGAVLRGYGLCHGRAGNAETLLRASRVLEEPEWRQLAISCLEEWAERFELAGLPWPSGNTDLKATPTLMLGDAGIGYQYLRACCDEMPSILQFSSGMEARHSSPAADNEVLNVLRRQHVARHFGTTVAAFGRLSPDALHLGDDALAQSPFAPAQTARVSIETSIERTTKPERQALMRDASSVDIARAQLFNIDHSILTIERLAHESKPHGGWQQGRWRLASHVRIVEQLRDWRGWLRDDTADTPMAATYPHTMLIKAGEQIDEIVLSAFAGITLAALATPRSLQALVDHAARALPNHSVASVTTAVIEQLTLANERHLLVRTLDATAT